MSQITDLRGKEENSFNFIELLERLSEIDTTDPKNTKYLKMLDRVLKERIKERIDKMSNDSFGENVIENAFIAMLFSNFILPQEMYMLNYFCDKHKKGGISGIDFQTVDIDTIISRATEIRKKELEAQKENMFEKIHEDDEWLLLQPLSYEASLKYGASTKWCTASRDTRQHYNDYTKRGILIYCINKTNDDKFGFFFNFEHESPSYNPTSAMSFWNAEDNFVEIFDTSLPMNIIKSLREYVKGNKTSNDKLTKKKYAELFNSASAPGALSGRDMEIIDATRRGRSLEAVKLIKDIADLDIKAAKELYDSYYKPRFHPDNN